MVCGVRGGILEEVTFQLDLKNRQDPGEGTGKTLQREKTACAKALRW